MAEPPDLVDARSARDLKGRANEIWVRRTLASLIAIVPVLALFNVFGQRSSDVTVHAPAANLTVHAPADVRGGLLFEARFTIVPRHPLSKAVLVLSPGWADGLTINTVEPQPSNESSDHGWLSLDLGSLPPNQVFALHLQYQVNPTTVGSRELHVKLFDGATQLAEVSRGMRVFP